MSRDQERKIFELAIQKPSAERDVFLEGACLGDAALRQRIETLLAEYDSELAEPVPSQETTTDIAPERSHAEGVGLVIGRYKLLEKVGEGGFGVVYVAEQKRPVKRRVALKIIKLGMDTKQVVARFEAERQALALMDHPNIAKVLDAGATDTGRPYFVMELVRGIPITDYCDQEKVNTKERLDLFINVCRAIQHAHQKGIIHRDIKPSNILVTLHDGMPVPKVIDFGIAKATQQDLTDKTVYTQLQQFIGTPAYMSPEQAEMSGLDIDTRSDIYSLGVLLYELLTGSTPFDTKALMRDGIDAMRKTIREQEPAKPSSRLSQTLSEPGTSPNLATSHSPLATDLDWIVMKCLEKDRTRRYDTANGLAMDLKRHLNHEPVVARPPSAMYRLQKACRRNKTAYCAGVAVFVALVAGLSFAALGWHQALVQGEEAVRARNEARASETAQIEEARRAEQARAQAEANAQEARRNLYAADMNLASQALKENNWGKAKRILKGYGRDESLRDLLGWEWRYMWYEVNQTYQIDRLDGHTNMVSGVAFLGNSNQIASSSYDGTVRIWDRRTEPFVPLQNPQQGKFKSLQATLDGEYLAGLREKNPGRGAVITVWDTRTHEPVASIETWDVRNQIRSFALVPDKQQVVYFHSSSGQQDAVYLYDWQTPSDLLLVRDLGKPGPVRVSAQGNMALIKSEEGYRIVPLADPNAFVSIRLSEGAFSHSAATSPDGSIVAIGLWKPPYIQLFNGRDGSHLADLAGHSAFVAGLVFSANGETLYSASADQTIRIWDVSSREALAVYRGHTDEAWDIDLSPDGKVLVTGGKDYSIRLWPAEPPANEDPVLQFLTEHEFQMLSRHPAKSTLIARDRDERNLVHFLVVAGREDPVRRSLRVPGARILWVGLAPGGESLIVVDGNAVSLWDPETGEKIREVLKFPTPIGRATNFRLWVSGPVLLTPEGYLWLDELEQGTAALHDDEEWPGLPSASTINPQGSLKALGWSDGHAVLLSVGRQTVPREWRPHTDRVNEMAFSADGSTLYTIGNDGFTRVWDVETLKPLGPPMRAQLMSVHTLALSPDESRLATGDAVGGVTIWDLEQYRELGTFHRPYMVSYMEFISDDLLILRSGGQGSHWAVWRASPREEIDWSVFDAERDDVE